MAWPLETAAYCSWKEIYVTSEKGRKEVHYYLKRRDGSADLAVVGREKNSRRISYRYALNTNRPVPYKLNTRGDVVDWLNSVVSDVLPQDPNMPAAPATMQAARELNIDPLKDAHYPEPVLHSRNFTWMGSLWTCRKRRKHYPSFVRNGVSVSVNDFVYVLAEENKRLIAYLEDMYEDYKGSKMVVVRWFHKTDEVGILLPHNVNDREIFFSLSLQEINIECIDGLATVLCLQHYEKFLEEFMHGQPVVFFCQTLYEDDVMKPYDITQLKGYWKQEIFRYLNVTISKSGDGAQQPGNDLGVGGDWVNCVRIRLRKRRRSSPVASLDTPLLNDQKVDCNSIAEHIDFGALPAPRIQAAKPISSQYIKKGSLVEVLSQDCGIRGCWFRAQIIKKHKDKVKVQYQDIRDAEDESKKLEEWISTSRIAPADQFGLRNPGRKMIRPPLEACKANSPSPVDVGMPVDVWWFDGWWEGIVVQKVSEERFEVYLPGENKISIFHCSDLRQSQEWLGDEWVHVKTRSDLVSSVRSSVEIKHVAANNDEKLAQDGVGDAGTSLKGEAELTGSPSVATTPKASFFRPVPDLLKDVLVSNLKWKKSRKRKRSGSCCSPKLGLSDCFPNNPLVMNARDCENCKFMGGSLFGSSVAPRLTGLVMSR